MAIITRADDGGAVADARAAGTTSASVVRSRARACADARRITDPVTPLRITFTRPEAASVAAAGAGVDGGAATVAGTDGIAIAEILDGVAVAGTGPNGVAVTETGAAGIATTAADAGHVAGTVTRKLSGSLAVTGDDEADVAIGFEQHLPRLRFPDDTRG